MPQSGSPTARRRRLAAELRRLRGNRTGTEVSRDLRWSPTKISRAESGREAIPPEEVEKLVDYYGVADPLRAWLLVLAQDATRRGWWEDYASSLAPEYLEYIGLEAEAASIADWQPDVVPGLLQTEAYTRQISVGYQDVITTPPSAIEQVVRIRMIRQERLTIEPVLHLSAVIEESVLLRRMGDNDLMRAQLEHLVNLSELPNVEVRILPLDRGLPLIATSFSILSFESRPGEGGSHLGDVVYIEGLKGQQSLDSDDDTYLFRLFFQALTRAALAPDASSRLLKQVARHRWA